MSTSSFPEALRAILGDGVVGLSANNIVRLKQVWEQEFEAWSKRDLHGKRYVYLWADAVYFNVRLEKDRPCVLVVVGATEDGHKELLAIQDGERESHFSWLHLLQDLKARGLKEHSFLAIADGALPGARAQQCWVHKTANVLDKMSQRTPRRQAPAARDLSVADQEGRHRDLRTLRQPLPGQIPRPNVYGDTFTDGELKLKEAA